MREHGKEIEVDVNDAPGVWSDVLPFFQATVPPRAGGRQYRIRIERPGATLGYSAEDANRNHVYAHGMTLRLRHVSARLSVLA